MSVTTVTAENVPHGASADVWEVEELDEDDGDGPPDETERLPRRARRRRLPHRRA